MTELRCVRCGREGHLSKDCKQPIQWALESRRELRGFGVTIMATGGARRWYVGADGVQRWADNDRPVT